MTLVKVAASYSAKGNTSDADIVANEHGHATMRIGFGKTIEV